MNATGSISVKRDDEVQAIINGFSSLPHDAKVKSVPSTGLHRTYRDSMEPVTPTVTITFEWRPI